MLANTGPARYPHLAALRWLNAWCASAQLRKSDLPRPGRKRKIRAPDDDASTNRRPSVIQRVQHIVYATVVMRSSDGGDCRQVELEMGKRGFHPRGAIVQGARECVCNFVQEHARGTLEQLRDQACKQLADVARQHARSWRGYVQVCGNEGAWATLSPGKPPVLGTIEA